MIRLLRAEPGHIPAIAALEAVCFADPWPADLIGRLLDRFTAAVEGDTLVGYLAFSSVLDEGSVDNVAVAPAYRRRGVAGLLLSDAIRRAREDGLSLLTLEVRASNAPAAALYEGYGFREVGRRRDYYEKPREDAILMTLVL